MFILKEFFYGLVISKYLTFILRKQFYFKTIKFSIQKRTTQSCSKHIENRYR